MPEIKLNGRTLEEIVKSLETESFELLKPAEIDNQGLDRISYLAKKLHSTAAKIFHQIFLALEQIANTKNICMAYQEFIKDNPELLASLQSLSDLSNVEDLIPESLTLPEKKQECSEINSHMVELRSLVVIFIQALDRTNAVINKTKDFKNPILSLDLAWQIALENFDANNKNFQIFFTLMVPIHNKIIQELGISDNLLKAHRESNTVFLRAIPEDKIGKLKYLKDILHAFRNTFSLLKDFKKNLVNLVETNSNSMETLTILAIDYLIHTDIWIDLYEQFINKINIVGDSKPIINDANSESSDIKNQEENKDEVDKTTMTDITVYIVKIKKLIVKETLDLKEIQYLLKSTAEVFTTLTQNQSDSINGLAEIELDITNKKSKYYSNLSNNQEDYEQFVLCNFLSDLITVKSNAAPEPP